MRMKNERDADDGKLAATAVSHVMLYALCVMSGVFAYGRGHGYSVPSLLQRAVCLRICSSGGLFSLSACPLVLLFVWGQSCW